MNLFGPINNANFTPLIQDLSSSVFSVSQLSLNTQKKEKKTAENNCRHLSEGIRLAITQCDDDDDDDGMHN